MRTKMAQGSIVENLSGRKLAVLAGALVACQLVCFFVGAFIAPAPSGVMPFIGTKCIDFDYPDNPKAWFFPRAKTIKPCVKVHDFSDPIIEQKKITSNQIVFAFQMPSAKDNRELDFTRWQQRLIGVLQPDIVYDSNVNLAPNATLRLDMRMGYRNIGDKEGEWKELAQASEDRPLNCHADHKLEGYGYHCELIPLFELGSLHHDFYLVNIRLPIEESDERNKNIGRVTDLTVVVIYQNGGFTKVWLSMKCVFLPLVILIMGWFWRRIKLLARVPLLLEQMLMALGASITLLNLPLELPSLWFDMPWMLLLGDIRQGIFYAMLLSFWLVFVGEHMMDDVQRNRLSSYYKHLSAIVLGCFSLFLFDMCERGTQLRNPFYSIWVTRLGTSLAFVFIVFAIISACIYLLFLTWMIWKAYRNINIKRSSLPAMSQLRRLHYEGVIYRFKFLMLATFLCAALTVAAYIFGQILEGQWKWDMDKTDAEEVQYNSAFFTGVYGMWNIYVLMLLALYAPSHKRWPEDENRSRSGSGTEEIEFRRLPTEPSEASSLAAFMSKSSTD